MILSCVIRVLCDIFIVYFIIFFCLWIHQFFFISFAFCCLISFVSSLFVFLNLFYFEIFFCLFRFSFSVLPSLFYKFCYILIPFNLHLFIKKKVIHFSIFHSFLNFLLFIFHFFFPSFYNFHLFIFQMVSSFSLFHSFLNHSFVSSVSSCLSFRTFIYLFIFQVLFSFFSISFISETLISIFTFFFPSFQNLHLFI